MTALQAPVADFPRVPAVASPLDLAEACRPARAAVSPPDQAEACRPARAAASPPDLAEG